MPDNLHLIITIDVPVIKSASERSSDKLPPRLTEEGNELLSGHIMGVK